MITLQLKTKRFLRVMPDKLKIALKNSENPDQMPKPVYLKTWDYKGPFHLTEIKITEMKIIISSPEQKAHG